MQLALWFFGMMSRYFVIFVGGKLYYTGKCRKEKRLVILDDDAKRQVFSDCHDSASVGHWGQKKTLERIESLFFW